MNNTPDITAVDQQLSSTGNTTLNAKVKLPDVNANTHPELTAAEQQLASIGNTTLNAKVKLPDIYANKRSTISFRQH